MRLRTNIFCLCILFQQLSCSENSSKTEENEVETNKIPEIQKVSEGTFIDELGYINSDSTEMHFFLWTGWRYAKMVDHFQDTINKWLLNHPEAVVVPIIKLKEINKNGEINYLSLFIDKIKGDTLQIDMIQNGFVYAGHCLPTLDANFQKDSCMISNQYFDLLIPCIDFKKYVIRVLKIYQFMDTSQFHFDWKF